MTHNVSFGWAEDAAIHHLLVPDRGLLDRMRCDSTCTASRRRRRAWIRFHPLP